MATRHELGRGAGMSDVTVTNGAPGDVELAEYRQRVRSWLAANLERRTGPLRIAVGGPDLTKEDVDRQRGERRKLFDAGYTGIAWPKEYGGQGLSAEHQRIFTEESADYVLPVPGGIAGGVTQRIVAPTILVYGSERQKQEWIPRILSGEEIWVQFLSEPGAGSDLAGIRTRAVRDGDSWVLNGAKIWSSGAMAADSGICLARTDWEAPKHRGLTWFRVPTDAPGVTIRPIRQINGNAEFCEEFFDDVVIPPEDVFGEVNGGWPIANDMLAFERGAETENTVAPARPSPGPLAPDLVTLATSRGLEADSHARQRVARAHVNDFLHACLIRRVLAGIVTGKTAPFYASYIKLHAGAITPIRANIAMELGGTDAVGWDAADDDAAVPSTNYLNSRIIAIAGGSDQVQRNIISERVLGLPREPSYDSDKPFNEVLRDAERWGSTPPGGSSR